MFKEFYFEGNLSFGWVRDGEDWRQVKKRYNGQMTEEELLNAKRHCNKSDAFGFYAEYDNDYTLGDFIKENNMEL